MRELNRIIIHCAYTTPRMDVGAAEIRLWHLERGWSDIGYHYVIRRDGTVEAGRPVSEVGAHAKGYNVDSIGICLVGGKGIDGKDDANFTSAQWAALRPLVDELVALYGIRSVIGHRDVSDKACPCFDVAAWRNV